MPKRRKNKKNTYDIFQSITPFRKLVIASMLIVIIILTFLFNQFIKKDPFSGDLKGADSFQIQQIPESLEYKGPEKIQQDNVTLPENTQIDPRILE